MRRTRHVVLPVRSWQYIGLLLVSLACVTFGLIARDREGQAGSLTGPELLHRAPHNVDVCPNLNPLTTSSVCLSLPEKQYLTLKNNEGKEIGSDIIRVERKKSIESCINRNAVLERRHRTLRERRVSERSSYPTNRQSRSLERVDSRIENIRLSYRHSPNPEMTRDITDRIRQLSRRFSNDKFRSIERREQKGIKRTDGQRTLDNRELKERRERFEVDTRRKFDSRGIEKREIRNIERTIGDNRKNVRENTQDNRSNSVERQIFRSENMERRFMKERRSNDRRNSRIDTSDRQSNIDVKRRNSRVDTLNRERRLDIRAERRNSRLDTVNRQRESNLSVERRNSRLNTSNRERRLDVSAERKNFQLDTFNRERQSNIDAERRNSRTDTLNRERRLDVRAEHRNSRLETINRQRGSTLSVERRNSRLHTFNRERQSNIDAEHRNSRADTLNRERRLDLSAERRNSRLDTVNSQRGLSLSVERRNSRLNTFNRERQSNIDAERRNSRTDTLNRERRLDVSAERRNSRLDTFKRERQSNIDPERRNSRADTLNRERRLDVSAERRNSRLDTINSQRGSSLSAERRNSRLDTVNSQRGSSLSVERRNSRLNTFNRERQSNIDAERRNSRTDTLNRERRLDVSAERRNSRLDTINSRRESNLSVERRNSRLNTLNRERRLDESAERRNSRLDTVNSQRRSSLNVERRNSRLDTVNSERGSSLSNERRNSLLNTFNRERRLSVDVERKNSQHDTFNRERQSNVGVEYRNNRRDTSNRERRSSSMTDLTRTRNRYDRESIISNFLRIRKSTSHDNTPADRHDIRRKNSLSEIRNIRFNSLKRQQSGNRLENQRFEQRMIYLENRELFDRRSRSVDRQNMNTLDRNNRYLGLERRILIDRASEYIDRRDNRRELVNRLSRSSFSIRNSRGEIVHIKPNRSSESIDNYEQRNILLNHRIMEIQKPNRREVNTLRRTVRSSNIEYLRNSPRIARYSFDRSFLDHTNRIERFSNERSNEKLTERRSTRGEIAVEISFAERRQTQYGQRRIARTLTPEISNRRSFIARKYHVSRQGESFQALSRSFDNTNRLNSNERRESVESRRFRTDNNRRSSVLLTDRQDTQRQRENLARTSILLRTNDLQERRRLNMRVQERYNRKIQRTISERRKSTESNLAGKVERSTELQSHDHQRNVRLNLIVTRHNDSLYREVNDDFDKGFKLIERSRSNTNRRSSYRRLVDLRQFNSLRDKIKTSEMSIRDRNTLFVPMIDRDRFDLIRDGEKTRRLFDTNHRTQKISLEFRNDEYEKQTGMIANLLKTNVLSNYDLSFEIIRQPFIIIICILYGSSMSKNNKLFTDNLMQRIPKFALW